MSFSPTPFAPGADPLIHDVSGSVWVPYFEHDCSFNPEIFDQVMMNLVRNPNLNTAWLFRADILYDSHSGVAADAVVETPVPRIAEFMDFEVERTLVRRMMPRNTRRDSPLDQTCVFLRHREPSQPQKTRSLVVYLPHESSVERMPFYHPKVRGVAHMHEWHADTNQGRISLHYWLFEDVEVDGEKLERTALMLLSILHKHGQGQEAGYTKRVHHDVVVPQARFQDRYLALKLKYAKDLVDTWAESTDPQKHVFEDLGIAAFLIELWSDMYKESGFPGFVDIGCGNGLLVHILLREGYPGWGFDARARKSWEAYGKELSPDQPEPLKRLVLLPTLASPERLASASRDDGAPEEMDMDPTLFHDGCFPKGTFIISNHADELTPWTPILATLSESPFIMIPCCSHNLGGAKYRAPPPRDKTKAKSAYSSLVDWVAQIAEDCGWKVETEMLRIPSTRNCALLGRTRTTPAASVDARHIVEKYGGTQNYFENAIRLTKAEKGH
ncbi:DUF1613-domain-containing protein [Sodiomyces alkalinus F11]|uniref:tRNA (uracil-O(2)-)-methyltransferase n=1 Tax=Sodiomyces alkalinus (strain CBS 110278 / VKM F-3762 / F11) TaxID=1314773 RepID=A0A3N2Q2Z0_SODAK|nr:DUF1613-domain-containing protein [Sodiomyces alkalinus F11]ROT41123.1 DUF1613-domain-containing protein [Sodiomyces alkalinus F11]